MSQEMADAPQITHAAGCWQWSREHYWCALREVDRLRARADNTERHVEELQAKIKAESCGCSLDAPGDVCEHHSPALVAALERAVQAERENAALYEWKERAGQMDREKTVRIVELEAEKASRHETDIAQQALDRAEKAEDSQRQARAAIRAMRDEHS